MYGTDFMKEQQLETIADKIYEKIVSRFEGRITKPKTNKELLTNAEACEYLQVCSKTLKKYRDSGTLEYSKVGRKFYYQEKDLLEFLKKNRPTPFINRLKQDFRNRI